MKLWEERGLDYRRVWSGSRGTSRARADFTSRFPLLFSSFLLISTTVLLLRLLERNSNRSLHPSRHHPDHSYYHSLLQRRRLRCQPDWMCDGNHKVHGPDPRTDLLVSSHFFFFSLVEMLRILIVSWMGWVEQIHVRLRCDSDPLWTRDDVFDQRGWFSHSLLFPSLLLFPFPSPNSLVPSGSLVLSPQRNLLVRFRKIDAKRGGSGFV